MFLAIYGAELILFVESPIMTKLVDNRMRLDSIDSLGV